LINRGKRALTTIKFQFLLKEQEHIKQAIQGLFTAGTSEKKEKVGGKRGLTLRFAQGDIVTYCNEECPNNPAGTN